MTNYKLRLAIAKLLKEYSQETGEFINTICTDVEEQYSITLQKRWLSYGLVQTYGQKIDGPIDIQLRDGMEVSKSSKIHIHI